MNNNTNKLKIKRNVVKVFDKDGLMKAAKHAENEEKNRSVYTDKLQKHVNKQPEDTVYPIVFDFVHNDIEIRAQIEIDSNNTIWLDVDIDKFNKWSSWHDFS